VGTAGAVRYRLPAGSPPNARTDVYGYLLGTVNAHGEIRFAFQELGHDKLPADVAAQFDPRVVNFCFSQNSDNKPALELCPECSGVK
jgi:hypothetical protein